jgi:nucleoside-diphosphate-sugar epimerase
MDGSWGERDVAVNGRAHAGWSGEGRVLVTGCAGFIGSHLSERLLQLGCEVVGVDCFTDYYARESKERNLAGLREARRFSFAQVDLSEDDLSGLLEDVSAVFHLAGQPGVRLSFGESFAIYLRHNLLATQRLLEATIGADAPAFTYASSSSVYGDTPHYPTRESSERRPVSPYGLTKLAAEELAGVYHRDFGVAAVGVRYFTVYGPRQRPDMAFSRFLRSALDGEPLLVLGDGRQVRDFTYVDDIVSGTIAAARRGRPGAVYNLGAEDPVELCEVFDLIGELVERPVMLDRRPALVGDASRTGSDGTLARRELGFAPRWSLRDGLAAQLRWMQAERDELPAAVPA